MSRRDKSPLLEFKSFSMMRNAEYGYYSGRKGANMANGMASLMVGATGLKSAQTALHTTAHNLANINTKGYTRQQIAFSDTQYVDYKGRAGSVVSSNYGLGVAVSEIRRIRDQFIDSAYRSENSRLGYYESQYRAVEEVEDQLGEMQGVTYQECLTTLYDAINEISKEPASTVKRSSLVQAASAFMTRSDAVYNGLREYQTTLNVEVRNMIDKINGLGQKIYELNKGVARIEAAGIEDANDLRDQRDEALDELSKYININYYESENGEVVVSAENVPFVTLTSVMEMSSRNAEKTDLLIPTWPAFDRDVYKATEEYTNNSDNDKGELKGLLLARGNIYVDYTDVPVKPNQNDYDMTTDAGRKEYEKDYAAYLDKQDYYNKYIEPSVILSAICGLDKLVNGIAESINAVFCPEKTITSANAMTDDNGKELMADMYSYETTAATLYTVNGYEVAGYDNGDGTYSYKSTEKLYTDKEAANAADVTEYTYSMLDMDKTDYGMDEDRTVGEPLFARHNTERYVVVIGAGGEKNYIYNNANSRGDRSEFILGNICINSAVAQAVEKLPMHTLQGKEDMAKGQELVDVWNADFASVNPEQYAVGTFSEFYNNYVSDFATAGRVLNNYVGHQKTMVDGYDNQRLQTEGVSSDEELEKMIKYQQAYNASSRYVNVVSEMLEHLVTSLGSM